jgi:hypothetical protein
LRVGRWGCGRVVAPPGIRARRGAVRRQRRGNAGDRPGSALRTRFGRGQPTGDGVPVHAENGLRPGEGSAAAQRGRPWGPDCRPTARSRFRRRTAHAVPNRYGRRS